MPSGGTRGDREELRGLRLQLTEARAVFRLHPLWDHEHVLAARKVERLEGRVRDVQGRRPAEEWHRLLTQGDAVRLAEAGPQIEAHYPDALDPLAVFDHQTRCKKCGGRADAKYAPDRIRRTCRRCGYSWPEIPLDSPLAPKTAKESPPPPEGEEGDSE